MDKTQVKPITKADLFAVTATPEEKVIKAINEILLDDAHALKHEGGSLVVYFSEIKSVSDYNLHACDMKKISALYTEGGIKVKCEYSSNINGYYLEFSLV